MTDTPAPPHTTSVVISGNNSLNARDGWFFYGSLLAFTVLIAGGWAALGYWPVLPFAGLELTMLGVALFVVGRRADYHELLMISPDEVRLERGRRREREVLSWPSAWARVELVPGLGGRRASQLFIAAAGKRTEIARMLPEDERRALHERLRELIAQARRAQEHRAARGRTAEESDH